MTHTPPVILGSNHQRLPTTRVSGVCLTTLVVQFMRPPDNPSGWLGSKGRATSLGDWPRGHFAADEFPLERDAKTWICLM